MFSNSTEKYGLGLYDQGDMFEPLTDWNTTMEKIDADMNTNSGAISAVQEHLQEIDSQITTNTTAIATMNTNVASLQNSMTTANNNITTLQTGQANTEVDVTNLEGRMTAAEQNIDALTGGSDFQELVENVETITPIKVIVPSNLISVNNSTSYAVIQANLTSLSTLPKIQGNNCLLQVSFTCSNNIKIISAFNSGSFRNGYVINQYASSGSDTKVDMWSIGNITTELNIEVGKENAVLGNITSVAITINKL